jgi:hypothetical protein
MSLLTDFRRVRRLSAAIGLLGFAPMLVFEAIVDPISDGTPADTLDAVTRHRAGFTAGAVLVLLSALLNLPAIYGVVHQARDRGCVLAHLGASFAALGALGHAMLAGMYITTLATADGTPAEMLAYLDRIDNSPVLTLLVVPLLGFSAGLTLLAFAAWRAGLIGWWGPATVTAAVAAHFLITTAPVALAIVELTAVSIVYGWIGIRTARLNDDEWAPVSPDKLQRPTHLTGPTTR